jgi:hypothetical protein
MQLLPVMMKQASIWVFMQLFKYYASCCCVHYVGMLNYSSPSNPTTVLIVSLFTTV